MEEPRQNDNVIEEPLDYYQQLQVRLIMESPKLKKSYEDFLMEKIKLDKKAISLNLLELKNMLKKDKSIDEEDDDIDNIDEGEVTMYPNV